jgi:hypothetical protein
MEDSARPWQRGGCIHELSVLGLQQVVTGDCLFWDLPTSIASTQQNFKYVYQISSKHQIKLCGHDKRKQLFSPIEQA